jgi:hypothetical protein
MGNAKPLSELVKQVVRVYMIDGNHIEFACYSKDESIQIADWIWSNLDIGVQCFYKIKVHAYPSGKLIYEHV